MNENIKKIETAARSWNGRSIYGVKGCPGETCAFFVRHVFEEALHGAGKMPVAHSRPYYKEHGVRALPTNENFADGLAGDEIGQKINLAQAMPGDLLFFRDTYRGDFPVGSITHIGICIGAGGMMADSSGGRCHVRNYHQTFPGLLVEVRRPRCLGAGIAARGTGISLTNGQIRAQMNGAQTKPQEIKIQLGAVASVGFGSMRMGLPNSATPHVSINGKAVPFFKYVTADIALAGQQDHIKLFYHHGQTRAFLHGKETKNLEIVARIGGGLHVWVNGREIKPTAVNIGVS